jgi:hypothetical protein
MTTHMSNETLQALEADIISNLRGGGSMKLMNAVSALIAQARQAPDPAKLPLSTAMRRAREMTEGGTETWVWVMGGLLGPFALKTDFALWKHAQEPQRWMTISGISPHNRLLYHVDLFREMMEAEMETREVWAEVEEILQEGRGAK